MGHECTAIQAALEAWLEVEVRHRLAKGHRDALQGACATTRAAKEAQLAQIAADFKAGGPADPRAEPSRLHGWQGEPVESPSQTPAAPFRMQVGVCNPNPQPNPNPFRMQVGAKRKKWLNAGNNATTAAENNDALGFKGQMKASISSEMEVLRLFETRLVKAEYKL